MARADRGRRLVIRSLLVLCGAIALAQLANLDDLLSSASRSLVLLAARALGVDATERGDALVLGEER